MDVAKNIFIELKEGHYFVHMWFLGKNWTLRTAGQTQLWMVNDPKDRILTPLKHFKDFEFNLHRQMALPEDPPMAAVEQAKFQLFRVKYRKPTPTFHEQHFNYFETS